MPSVPVLAFLQGIVQHIALNLSVSCVSSSVGSKCLYISLLHVEFRFMGPLTAGCYGVEASLLWMTRMKARL